MRNRELVKMWNRRIDEGLKYRKDEGDDKNWEVGYNYFRARYPSSMEHENLTFAIASQAVEESVPETPRVSITSIQPTHIAASNVLQQVINELFTYMNLVMELEDATLGSFFCGVYLLKIGYDSAYGYDPRLETPVGGTLSQFSKSGKERIEFFPAAAPGMPWVSWLPPWDLVVAPETRVLDESPWIAIRTIRYLEDAKKDEKYFAKARSALKASPRNNEDRPTGAGDMGPLFNSLESPEAYDYTVTLWEVWDRRSGEIIVLAEGNDDLVLRKDKSVLMDILQGYPIVGLTANRNGRCFWGDGDFVQMKPAQRTLNNLLTQLNEHARSCVVRHIVNPDLIEAADVKMLREGIPNACVRLRRGAKAEDLDQAFKTWTTQIPGELFPVMENVRRGVREALGYSSAQLGEHAGPPRRTAAEVQTVQMAHMRRAGRRAKLNRRAIVLIAKKLARMIFALWQERQVIRVAGPDGIPVWVEFSGNELEAEYRFEYVAEDKPPATTAEREQKAIALLNALPMLAQFGVQPDYVLKAVFKYFPEMDPEQAMARPAVAGEMTDVGGLQERMLGNARV